MYSVKENQVERHTFYGDENGKELLGHATVTYTDPLMSVIIVGIDGNLIYESDGFDEDAYNEASDFQKTFLDSLNLLCI
jgi:predicted DNA-binding protein with PD1-like motif